MMAAPTFSIVILAELVPALRHFGMALALGYLLFMIVVRQC